jgi:filamentous hemagglutinin family protein
MIRHLCPFVTTALFLVPTIVHSQTYQPTNRVPVTDNTLGTQVSGTNNNFDIKGGLNRGQNLFHSFQDFSVPTGGAANFTNPAGNQAIITRVTGNLFSDINGLVNTNGANFFLINPNGVVFGTNARLNVGKAFVTSTASGIDFVDAAGRTFTFGVNRAGDAPLLSIDPNVAFNPARLIMGGSNSGSKGIENYGTLQTSNSGQYIGLIGGDVTFNGGTVIAPGGRIDLGGLKSVGTVTTDSQGLVFSDNNLLRGDVMLTNLSQVDVEANGQLVPVNTWLNNTATKGSSINISANNLQIASNNLTSPTKSGLRAGLAANSGVQSLPIGDININSKGRVIVDRGFIQNVILEGAEANTGGNIKISSESLNLLNDSAVSTILRGKGTAGNIEIVTQGKIDIFGSNDPQSIAANPISFIVANSYGQGNSGKISIETPGKLSIFNSGLISSDITAQASGDSQGVSIKAGEVELNNNTSIFASTSGRGNGGNIEIAAIGDLTISGKSYISTNTYNIDNSQNYGNAGNIFLDLGNLKLIDSNISSTTSRTGNAGNIQIKARGDIALAGIDVTLNDRPLNTNKSAITSTSLALGNAGQISIINPSGKLSLSFGLISSAIEGKNAIGSSQGITINSRELEIKNNSIITSLLQGKGQAGNIDIKTTGNITISGNNQTVDPQTIDPFGIAGIISNTQGIGDAGKISIDTQGKLSLDRTGSIFSSVDKDAQGTSKGIKINAGELNLTNFGFISSETLGKNPAGDIEIATKGAVNINSSAITTSGDKLETIVVKVPGSNDISIGSTGEGKAGNISISSERLNIDGGAILSIANSNSGGNITLNLSDRLLLRNNSEISTSSGTAKDGGNGGNITITSPLIVALPVGNFGSNDITANAYTGKGGKVNITSQGIFGIQYRPQRSPLTNDITVSSTFGQNGNANIDTPGTDPGRDTTELPNTTTDASNQISQVCSANNRQNKLTVTGRGGLPPNANDPLTSDVVWQDARATSSQPTVSKALTPVKLAPPAVGWVFDGKGKVTLIAAGISGQPTGTRVVCPQEVR